MGKKRKGRGGFEVVPAGFTTKSTHQPKGKLAATRKAQEIWFRKAGHGERLFSLYYRGQGDAVCPEAEWETLMQTLRRPLPVTFRLRSGKRAAPLLSRLCTLAESTDLIAPVRWAPPEARLWQAAPRVGKRDLIDSTAQGGLRERSQAQLSELLKEGVSSGLLNRQELVSMLPVLALRVPRGAHCLDLCASPGQKTMQLLEAVAGNPAADAPLTHLRGLVVANDAHPKRVRDLLDALARHGRASAELGRLAVSCHQGQQFPMPIRPFGGGEAVGFDRVLADVPCSGDGTIRKDPTVRPRWTPEAGNQLHGVQLEIAWRGLQVLRTGELMAYSTCSLNPIEDEAVVAGLLSRSKGAGSNRLMSHLANQPTNHLIDHMTSHSTYHLTDQKTNHLTHHPTNHPTNHPTTHPTTHPTNHPTNHSTYPTYHPTVTLESWPDDVLPALVRRPGASHWKVGEHVSADGAHERDGERLGGTDGERTSGFDDEVRVRWHESYQVAVAAGMPHAEPTMWPPPAAEAADMQLHLCSRFLPHDQVFFLSLAHVSPDVTPHFSYTSPTFQFRTPAASSSHYSAKWGLSQRQERSIARWVCHAHRMRPRRSVTSPPPGPLRAVGSLRSMPSSA